MMRQNVRIVSVGRLFAVGPGSECLGVLQFVVGLAARSAQLLLRAGGAVQCGAARSPSSWVLLSVSQVPTALQDLAADQRPCWEAGGHGHGAGWHACLPRPNPRVRIPRAAANGVAEFRAEPVRHLQCLLLRVFRGTGEAGEATHTQCQERCTCGVIDTVNMSCTEAHVAAQLTAQRHDGDATDNSQAQSQAQSMQNEHARVLGVWRASRH